jgi:sugar phosphate isomerase/epimerase
MTCPFTPSPHVLCFLLDQNPEARKQIRRRVREVLENVAGKFPALVLFPGRNESVSEEQNYEEIAQFFSELVGNANSGTKIVVENWPGMSKNFIATTPAGWRHLFELVSSPDLGLEFDPSHLLWQGIDPFPVISEFGNRIQLIHAKDTKLDHNRVQDVGYCGKWWEYRLPGRGELDWKSFLESVKRHAPQVEFASIEHEDFEFGWPGGEVEKRKQGLLQALSLLRS